MKKIVFAALLAVTLAACGSGEPKGNSSPPPSNTRAQIASTAVIRIVSPTPGETVSTKGAMVKISLTGARIVKSGSTSLKPDEGHIHLSVDGRVITLIGTLEVSTGPLAAGPHLIEIEFAASDHGPFVPRVIQQVTVTAQ